MISLEAEFAGCATSHVSDATDRLQGSNALRSIHGGRRLIGFAMTVRVRAGDNLLIHKALQLVKPGSVLVVAGEGDPTRALVGEIMMRIARARGCAGFVIDGAVRDAASFAEADFPCFARAVTHRGPYKSGPGSIGDSVCIDGMVVNAGDAVLGDGDGVVAVPAAMINEVGTAARAIAARELETIRAIEGGTYDESWVDLHLQSLSARTAER